MPFPTFSNLGPASSGTGAITVNWPTNYATNDVGFLICQSSNEAVTETSGGWTQVAASPQGVGTAWAPGSTRLTVFRKRTAGTMAAAQIADAGDHVSGVIALVRGCPITGDPVDIALGGTEAAVDESLSLVGPSTVSSDCLVLVLAAHGVDTASPQWSGGVAPNLGTLIERYDKSVTDGNGGGVAVWSGTLKTAGAVGDFSATGLVASAKAWIVIGLKPVAKLLNTAPVPDAPGPWQISNPGGGGTFTRCVGGPTGIILVASNLAGVYMSTDDGVSWTNKG